MAKIQILMCIFGEIIHADMASQKRERFWISSSFQVEGSYHAGDFSRLVLFGGVSFLVF